MNKWDEKIAKYSAKQLEPCYDAGLKRIDDKKKKTAVKKTAKQKTKK